jgi:hypothetical protein
MDVCHILEFGALWARLETLSCILESLFILLNEVPGSGEDDPHLFISWFDLERFEAVLLASTKLSDK